MCIEALSFAAPYTRRVSNLGVSTMTTATVSPRHLPLFTIGSTIAAAMRTVAEQLRAARRQRSAAAQLEILSDRLRQDIGLTDSSPTAGELIKRFHRAHRPLPREHEQRIKLWS
jgi:uncharacterized protein YjiS (DUF1127 family)